MMLRLMTLAITAVLLALPVQAQTSEVPPTAQLISWSVFRPTTGENFFFCDPTELPGCTGGSLAAALFFVHEELDVVQLRYRLRDGDWDIALFDLNMEMPEPGEDPPETPDYEGIFAQVEIFGLLSNPEPPIIPSVTIIWPADLPNFGLRDEEVGQFFGADGDDENGFTPTQEFQFGDTPPPFTDLVISLQLGELVGPNVERLRGLIDFDASYLVSLLVSNEDDSEEITFGTTVEVRVVENPALAPLNPQAVPDAAASSTLVVAGTQVTLDGSGTFDSTNTGLNPDDDEVLARDTITYIWEWISGPVRVDPVQTESTDPIATVVLTQQTPADGSDPYVYRLLATDGINAIPNADTVSIDVVATLPTNAPPTVSIIGPGAPVVIGDIITLDGSGSADADGDELTFRWIQTNALGGELEQAEVNDIFQPLSGLDEAITTWQAIEPGRFFFRLLVSDGNFTTSTQFVVDVIQAQVNGAQFIATEQLFKDLFVADEMTLEPDPQPTPTAQDLTTPTCGLFGLFGLGLLPFGLIAMRPRRR